MSLAAIGVGMTGAAPIFFKGNKRDKEEDQTELTEEKKETEDMKEMNQT